MGLGESTWANYDTGELLGWGFLLSLSRGCNEKTREKEKNKKASNSILSVIVAFQCLSSVLFVLPLWAQYHSLLFDCYLNPLWVIFLRTVALELNLISNSLGSGLYKSTAKYDHSLPISTCMNCTDSLWKVVELLCRLKSQGHPSLFNLLTSDR